MAKANNRTFCFSSFNVSAKQIAIRIYNIVHTIGNTMFGGVIDGFIQSYQAVFVAFIADDGIRATNMRVLNAMM